MLLGFHFVLQNSHSYEDLFTVGAGSFVVLLRVNSHGGMFAIQELQE
jgi:hypothetical protein